MSVFDAFTGSVALRRAAWAHLRVPDVSVHEEEDARRHDQSCLDMVADVLLILLYIYASGSESGVGTLEVVVPCHEIEGICPRASECERTFVGFGTGSVI
jgi:hypothetical protein